MGKDVQDGENQKLTTIRLRNTWSFFGVKAIKAINHKEHIKGAYHFNTDRIDGPLLNLGWWKLVTIKQELARKTIIIHSGRRI